MDEFNANNKAAQNETGLPFALSQEITDYYSPFSLSQEAEIRRLENQNFLPVIPDALRRLESIRESIVSAPIVKPPSSKESTKASLVAGTFLGAIVLAATHDLGMTFVAGSATTGMLMVRRMADWASYKNERSARSDMTRRIRLARKVLELRLNGEGEINSPD